MVYQLSDLAINTQHLELQDLQYSMPIGYWDGNNLIKDYQTLIYTGKTEILLEELENRYSGNYLVLYSLFLGIFITHLGFKSIQHSKDLPASELFQDFYLADIIAIILSIRLQNQGSEIALNSTCPCSTSYKITPDEAGYHDLNTLELTLWTGAEPPIFEYVMGSGQTILLEPPKFKDINRLNSSHCQLNYQNRITLSVTGLDEAEFYDLPRRDRAHLVHWANKIANFSADNKLEMDCPKCKFQWEAPLILGENYEQFYFDLLRAPRPEDGTVREYLDSHAQILIIGENAPLKSIEEVDDLTPERRKRWVETMSKFYEDQKNEMNKAKG